MAKEGVTDVHASTDTQCHFVTYVASKDGKIWELDGRLDGPLCKGQLREGDHLGMEVSKIIKSYIEMNEVQAAIEGQPPDIKFSVMALAPAVFAEDMMYI